MKIMFFILMTLTFFPSFALANEPTLIGGKVVEAGALSEVVYISSGRSRCSGVLVGEETLLTAAHCITDGGEVRPAEFVVSQQVFKAQCTHHPLYKTKYSYDFALCKTKQKLNGPFASIGNQAPKIGSKVSLMGYGCINPRQGNDGGDGGNDGKLRWGNAKVTKVDNGTNGTGGGQYYFTDDKTALCFGDSGGPSMEEMQNPKTDKHIVIGINSRGDIKTRSLHSGTYNSGFQTWAAEYAISNEVKICGINKDCDKPEPDPEPDPEEWDCIEEKYNVWQYTNLLEEWKLKLKQCKEMEGIILL